MTDSTVPLARRPGDWFFVVAFTCFAASSFLSDVVPALGLAMTPNSPSALARATYFYAKDADPFLLSNPYNLRISVFISAFVFDPFYPVLVWAFVRGRNWIRVPAIAYAAAMTYGMIMFLGFEFLGPLPPTNLPWFLGWNLPYLLVPLALAWRMRHPEPFGSGASAGAATRSSRPAAA
jgi:hypothetical protein